MLQLSDETKQPPIPQLELPECLQWLNGNTSRNYYSAVWSTLVHLKPKYCLELGTFKYYSAKIFSEYFRQYMPDGLLLTCDISTWNRDKEAPERVYPVMVYPHREDINQFHGGIKVYHKNYKQVLQGLTDAAIVNSIIIAEEMSYMGIDLFDLAYVDAGHDLISAKADLCMAKSLTKPDGWIFIDDVTNNDHALKDLYKQLTLSNTFYEFDNWDQFPDMALVKRNSLDLRNLSCQ